MKKKFRIKCIKRGGSKFTNYQQYGIICIKSRNYGILSANQLESVRRCILRKIKKKGLIWIRIQCIFPITKKSSGSRMGKGIGSVKFYISNVKQGFVLLELQTSITKAILLVLKRLNSKLSINTSIMFKSYY
jgi:ribosomal protein L16